MTRVALKEKQQGKAQKLSSIAMGSVSLYVNDLATMREFYEHVLGLDVLGRDESRVELGKGKKSLIVLHKSAQLHPPSRRDAGLYHFALLFSSRGELARRIEHILTSAPHHFSGSADHLVSEAFYFTDPEGNGIELYFDRSHDEWVWENGQIRMASLYIDPATYIRMYGASDKKKSEIGMGHVHLKVGDIEKARAFYVDVLGFDITAQLPGALFISVGGYHHHIGVNTWESMGAQERGVSLGLKSYDIVLSQPDDLVWLTERLRQNDIIFEEGDYGIVFSDPWKNQIRVTPRS